MTSHSEDLTLFDIEAGLAEALAAREEAATPEEIAAADLAIEAYRPAEVAKIDSIAGYLRHCLLMTMAAKVEADRMTARAKAWEGRRKRLLEFVQRSMNAMGKRRLEGRVNTLLLKVNGGRQPVEIQGWDKEYECWFDNPGLLPKEFYEIVIHISLENFQRICNCVDEIGSPALRQALADARNSGLQESTIGKPRLSAIYAALQKPCPACKSLPIQHYGVGDAECPMCGGSGLAGVPGARLLDRGEHVEVK